MRMALVCFIAVAAWLRREMFWRDVLSSLRKQSTFRNVTTGFPAKMTSEQQA